MAVAIRSNRFHNGEPKRRTAQMCGAQGLMLLIEYWHRSVHIGACVAVTDDNKEHRQRTFQSVPAHSQTCTAVAAQQSQSLWTAPCTAIAFPSSECLVCVSTPAMVPNQVLWSSTPPKSVQLFTSHAPPQCWPYVLVIHSLVSSSSQPHLARGADRRTSLTPSPQTLQSPRSHYCSTDAVYTAVIVLTTWPAFFPCPLCSPSHS